MKKRIKRTISILLCVFMVTGLFAIVPIEAGAAGNSWNSATVYYPGNQVNGSITNTNTADYYKFTLSSSGKINLIANSYMRYIYYNIYDASYNQVIRWNSSWDDTTKVASKNEVIDLVSGTYYFVVSKNNNTGNYSFKLNFTSANESFAESQNLRFNDYSTAKSISIKTTYYGQLAENDEVDYYKFTLSTSGKVNLIANSYMRYIYYSIYDASYNRVIRWNSSWDDTTKVASKNEVIDLVSGTYYFVVSKNNNTGNYNFKLNFTSANESFTESQNKQFNEYSTAKSISIKSTYYGQLAENDEVDYYKFTLSSSGKINLIANSYMRYIYYSIYDSSYNRVIRWNPSWNSSTKVASTNEVVDLVSGTYYFVVSKDNNTGNYNFKLSPETSDSVSTPKITGFDSLDSGVKITWNKVSGAVKYRVYYYGKNGWTSMGDTTSTSFIDTDVGSGKTYTYSVRCVNSDGTKYTSNMNTTGWKYTYNMSTPQITKITSTNQGVNITWGKVNNASRYRVYYKNKNGNWVKMVETTSTSYLDTDVSFGKNYTYTVRCVNANGRFTSDCSGTGWKHLHYLSTPKITSLVSSTSGVKITWNSVNYAAKYRVYYYGSKGWTRMAETTGTSFLDTDVRFGSNYTYTVRCITSNGSTFTSDCNSSGWKHLHYLNTPSITSFSSTSKGVRITWNSVGAAKYRVYYYGRNGWTRMGETTGTSFIDTDVRKGTTYRYTVRCINSGGTSFTSDCNSTGWKYTYNP